MEILHTIHYRLTLTSIKIRQNLIKPVVEKRRQLLKDDKLDDYAARDAALAAEEKALQEKLEQNEAAKKAEIAAHEQKRKLEEERKLMLKHKGGKDNKEEG